jgi:hypothetical protein
VFLLAWLATGCGKVKTLEPGDGPDASGGDGPVCGDGRVQAGEDCDDDGESADCNDDCTVAACGDGVLNASAGEDCEPDGDDAWTRCGARCTLGVGLTGEFSEHWIEVAAPEGDLYLQAFQSFHYTGQRYLYELQNNLRYDIEANEWSAAPVATPWLGTQWPNGAVDAGAIWVPRDGKMFRYDLEDEEWTAPGEDIPDGATSSTAAVFDSAGQVWYHGPGDALVRYSTADGSYESFEHTEFPGYDVDETRIAYDPVHDLIAFTGFGNDRFLVFDIEEETFHEGTPSESGQVSDNTCQDRSGHIYTGNGDHTKMFRYDIGEDTWEELPLLPRAHDNAAGCVVSQDGFLYYATRASGQTEVFRLGLEVR